MLISNPTRSELLEQRPSICTELAPRIVCFLLLTTQSTAFETFEMLASFGPKILRCDAKRQLEQMADQSFSLLSQEVVVRIVAK